MAPNTRGEKSRHTTMEPESPEEEGSEQHYESDGETSGELVPTTDNTPVPSAYFPGLSRESASSLTSWMTATKSVNNVMLQQQMDAREARQQQQITEQFAATTASLQTMMRELITNRPENIEIPSIQSPPPQPPQQSQMHLHTPPPTPTQSLPAPPS
ncbi:MAG: hypothetical protein Q9161_008979 [Pseudevernia consocians]